MSELAKEEVKHEEAAGETKTFTQEEVNSIVSDRLIRERSKYSDYNDLKEKAQKYDEQQEAGKSELQKANERAEQFKNELDAMKKQKQIQDIRTAVSAETGVPSSLLLGESEEDCRAQAEAIKKYAEGTKYPEVHDGGEPQKKPTGTPKEQFAAWFNENIK